MSRRFRPEERLALWQSWNSGSTLLQIAQELDINKDDARAMIHQLRQGIVERRPPVVLEGEVECDEVYVVAGHKGHPEAVKKKADSAADDA